VIELRTEIEIAASPQRVWAVLTDFAHYKDWNPVLVKASGKAIVGTKVPMVIKPPKGIAAPLTMKILVAEPDFELCWRGAMPIPGVFAGEHWFRIERKSDTLVQLHHGERFSGLIPKLLGPLLIKQLKAPYEGLNRALKARAESGR